MSEPLPTYFQLLTGIWSPADQAYTMIVQDEFASYKAAKKAAAEFPDDPTLTIVEIKARVLWRASAPPLTPPTWASASIIGTRDQ